MKKYYFHFLIVLVMLAAAAALPSKARAAELFIDPQNPAVPVESEVEFTVRLDPQGQVINAIEGEITLPRGFIAKKINDAGTFITLWTERPAQEGKVIKFSGIIPGGYRGDLSSEWKGYRPGTVFSVVAAVRENGIFEMNFASTSRALLNDGKGTPAPLSLTGSHITVRETGSTPQNAPVIYDVRPPILSSVQVAEDSSVFSGKKYLIWSARDNESGIQGFEVAEIKSRYFWPDIISWKKAEMPYRLKDQNLTSLILVKAIDNAGNITVETIEPAHALPWYDKYAVALVGVSFLAIFLVLYRRRS